MLIILKQTSDATQNTFLYTQFSSIHRHPHTTQTTNSIFTLQTCADSVAELCREPELQCDYDPLLGRAPVHAVQRSYHTGHAAVVPCAHASPPVNQPSAPVNSAPGFAE